MVVRLSVRSTENPTQLAARSHAGSVLLCQIPYTGEQIVLCRTFLAIINSLPQAFVILLNKWAKMFWTNLSQIAPQVLRNVCIKYIKKYYAEHMAISCLLIILEEF